ncbi:MAG: DUF86 domain-containing protein [Nitrospirota bacterium]
MKRDYRLYIDDILEAINKIEKYTEGMTMEDFLRDRKSIDAVTWNFQIIGEAVKHIPPEVREKYPHVPWKLMAGMRDKLAHEYFGIRYDVIWDTIKKRLPEVKLLIEEVLKKMSEEMEKS